MEVKSVFNSAFKDVDIIGVCIARLDKNRKQQHVGIIYNDGQKNDASILNLAWHFDLRKDTPDPRYLWIDIPLDRANKMHLANMCELIFASNEDEIPYGICIEGTGFAKDGTFTTTEQYAGLTCATFVIQVFHSQQFYIIDFDKWEHRRSNEVWQRQIIQLLERKADKEHIAYQRKKIQEGAARFKPEEVAAAACLPNPPHGAEQLKKPAKQILDLVIEHTKKYPI